MFRLTNALGLGPAYTPVGTIVSAHPAPNGASVPRTFWFKPASNLGLFILTMFYQQFTYVVLTQLALVPYRLVASSFSLSSRFGLRILRGYFPRQLHTDGLLLLHVPVGFVS